jgi:YtoQ family protein
MVRKWKVYLSGEVHSDWRRKLISACRRARLPLEFYEPVTDHAASDSCGAKILGEEKDKFWYDHKSAKINTIRNQVLLKDADVVIVRFGDKYKQWNAAFDAGQAAALGKPLIVQQQKDHIHALKEIDAVALAVCETERQLIRILKYVTTGKLGR